MPPIRRFCAGRDRRFAPKSSGFAPGNELSSLSAAHKKAQAKLWVRQQCVFAPKWGWGHIAAACARQWRHLGGARNPNSNRRRRSEAARARREPGVESRACPESKRPPHRSA